MLFSPLFGREAFENDILLPDQLSSLYTRPGEISVWPEEEKGERLLNTGYHLERKEKNACDAPPGTGAGVPIIPPSYEIS